MSRAASFASEAPLVASPNQTMRAIQVSRKKLYELINTGGLESYTEGKSRRITVKSIKETAIAAVENVEAANQQAQRLNTAAHAMSGIVQMIHEITGQINLLALNATIESARAGEAGRGFAVVAAEVKSLANQAKQATDKINGEIGSLNDIAGDVVGALSTIRSAIQHVSEYVTSTAAAVEEQSVVTKEMSFSMQRAAAEAASLGGLVPAHPGA
jgi:methyl-accepting chemotaxis protein